MTLALVVALTVAVVLTSETPSCEASPYVENHHPFLLPFKYHREDQQPNVRHNALNIYSPFPYYHSAGEGPSPPSSRLEGEISTGERLHPFFDAFRTRRSISSSNEASVNAYNRSLWGGPQHRRANNACTDDANTRFLCEMCAKETKSLHVYTLCCDAANEARDWCSKFITFGLHNVL